MEKFYGEIRQFLQHSDLYIYKVREGYGYISAKIKVYENARTAPLILINIIAESLEDAETQNTAVREEILRLTNEFGIYPLIITEDRWRAQAEMTHKRVLAHLEIFTQIYARNCEIKRIDKATAQAFLEANHSYGDATCKYRYGLYLKRHTGHNAHCYAEHSEASPTPGTLVAVATFSNARKWVKGDKTIRSYEWTRYASLPGIRLSGGMGRVLKTFLKEVQPDDIMTYADLEWSEGKVYEQLGFKFEGVKEAVTFDVNNEYKRSSRRRCMLAMTHSDTQQEDKSYYRYLMNFGSNKYRLKLTDYQ